MSKNTQAKLETKALPEVSDEFCVQQLPELTSIYGVEIATWILNQLETARAAQDYEFSDTFRCYEVGNAEQRERFLDIEASGCCGSFSQEFAHASGRTFVVGFNYGH